MAAVWLLLWVSIATLNPGTVHAVDGGVVGKRLIIVDKLAATNRAKVVFVAPWVNKGAGTNVEDISATFEVAYEGPGGSVSGAFVVPAGAFDGQSGWLVNSESVAKFVNKAAPGAPTGTRVLTIKTQGHLSKFIAKSLGDTSSIDVLGVGAPVASSPVTAVLSISSAGETHRSCTDFGALCGPDAELCAYRLIAGGTGAKLKCRHGCATVAACP